MNFNKIKAKIRRTTKSDYKSWIVAGIAGITVRYVVLAPVQFLPEGWLVAISSVAAYIVANYLNEAYKFNR